mmetsp:Transcript_28185/g.34324  ORF Transcript_28185/g.34324 Transcript_28185/m.34324 type:complete len:431 (+) Transcript_28185:89-1381(+)
MNNLFLRYYGRLNAPLLKRVSQQNIPALVASSSFKICNIPSTASLPARVLSTSAPSSSDTNTDTVRGEILDFSIDIRSLRPGDVISSPYELTVSESIQDFWHSAFHSQDRISTSTPFARKVGFQDRVLPFTLMLFLTSAMTHVDKARIQLGFDGAIYHWPAFAGDTVTKSYRVKSIRNTSDGNHSIVHFACELRNQRNRLIMSTTRHTMFPIPVPSSTITSPPSQDTLSQKFRDHFLNKSSTLAELGSHSLISLSPGQLILHTTNRCLTHTQSRQLASLARITHARHFDTRTFHPDTELLIPGGLVLGLALSASSRDLHEVLHEEMPRVSFVHAVHPNDVVGAMTYVKEVKELVGDLELLTVRTVGFKSGVISSWEELEFPVELFFTEGLSTREVEAICRVHCPELSTKIVVIADRKIIRQANKKEAFLL